MNDEHFEKLKREIEMTEDPDHLDFNGRDFGYKIGKFGVPFCIGAVVVGTDAVAAAIAAATASVLCGVDAGNACCQPPL